MQRFLTALGLAFLFATTACQTLSSIRPVAKSPSLIEGNWTVAAYECEFGKLNKAGIEINDRLKRGIERYQYTIDGEAVRIQFVTPQCSHDFTQNWKVVGSSIQVSDGNNDDVHSLDDDQCDPYPASKPRTHDFETVGSLLKVKLDNHYSVSTDGSNRLCSKGRDIVVFAKSIGSPTKSR